MSSDTKLSRRDFGRRTTFALAGSALLPSVAMPAAAEPSLPPQQAQNRGLPGTPAPPQQAEGSQVPKDILAEVESKYVHVIAQYGERLNPEQRARVRTVLEKHVRMLQTIRQVSLENSDPPALVLRLITG
jgi:hypothetical protein